MDQSIGHFCTSAINALLYNQVSLKNGNRKFVLDSRRPPATAPSLFKGSQRCQMLCRLALMTSSHRSCPLISSRARSTLFRREHQWLPLCWRCHCLRMLGLGPSPILCLLEASFSCQSLVSSSDAVAHPSPYGTVSLLCSKDHLSLNTSAPRQRWRTRRSFPLCASAYQSISKPNLSTRPFYQTTCGPGTSDLARSKRTHGFFQNALAYHSFPSKCLFLASNWVPRITLESFLSLSDSIPDSHAFIYLQIF